MTGPKGISEKSIKRRQVHLKPHTTGIFLLFLILLLGVGASTAQALTHPCLFFNNFTETPGWKYKDEEPYASWNSYIPWYMANYKMDYNFSDPSNPERDKAEQAYHFALAYHISGNSSFAEKAVEGLINLGNSTVDGLGTKSCVNDYAASAAGLYAITYDMMYNYIQANHSDVDAQIRDRLGLWAHYLYTNYSSTSGDVGTRFIRATSMGLIATAMPNYTSPYESNRSDWLTAATTWLFEQDFTGEMALRKYYNYGGLCRGIESYSGRWLDDLAWWLHAYKKNHNQTLWKISRDVYNALLYTSLPDGRRPNHGAQGNIFDEAAFSYYISDILPSNEGAWHKWYIDTYVGDSYVDKWLGYILYDKHAVNGSKPNFTTVISNDLESAVFRSGWNLTADYLWLRFFRLSTTVNRDMMHNDNLAFEYYSKGDLLLTDSGEIKHYIKDPNRLGAGGYGATDSKGHNTIMINDGSGAVGGATKGFAGTPVENPAYLQDYLVSDYFEFAEANMTITKIENRSSEPSPSNGWYWGFDTHDKITLTNPVTWKRTILYPKDYFIVLDTISGNVKRDIHNLFHLGSMNITKTTYDGDNATPGYVHGELWIDGIYVDWLNQSFGQEVEYGQANLVKWRTTSKYTNKPIELYLFTAPKSNVSVEKFWTRIDGYGSKNEVDHPIVRFKLNDSEMHRITVIYTINSGEEQPPTFEETTTEDFTSLHITTQGYDDYIASGNNINLPNYSTDSTYSFLRTQSGNLQSFFIRNSTYLEYNSAKQIETSKKVEHLALKYEGENRTFTVKGEGTDVNITLYQMNPSVSYQVKRDGEIYSNWVLTDDGRMIITTDLSEHTFEIEQTTPDTTPPSISNITETDITSNSATITWQTNEPSTSLVKYGTSPGDYSLQKYDSSPVTSHSITLTHLSPSTTYYFVVNSTDAGGNTNQSSEYSFKTSTEDKTPPSTTLTLTPQPNERGWINSIPVVVTFFRSDGVAYTNYSLVSQTGPWTTVNISTAIGPDAENVTDISEGRFNVSVTGEGVTTIWYYSVDTNTKPNVEPIKNLTVKIDYTAPIISNVSCIITNSTTITWETNELADSLVKYGTSPGNYRFQEYDPDNVTLHNISLTNLTANTTYYFIVISKDVADNPAQSSEYNFTTSSIDLPPVITIESPENKIYTTTSIWFNVSLNEPANWCAYSLDGAGNVTMNNDSATHFYAQASLAEGSHNVKFYCNDTAGNMNSSSIVYFTIDCTAPEIQFVPPTPDNGTVTSNTSVYINVSVSDTSDTSAFIDWDRSLVLWMRFNQEQGENSTFFRDWSSFANNGTCSGSSCPLPSTGKFGNALEFNGTENTMVSINDSDILDITDGITIEAWIYSTDIDKEQFIVAKIGNNPSGGYLDNYHLEIWNKKLWFQVDYPGVGGDTILEGNTWYHAAVTYNGSEVRFYLNGEPDGVKAYDKNMADFINDAPLRIGNDYYWRDTKGKYWGFTGIIDEVKVWNRVLSAEEIKASYNSRIYRLYRNFTDLVDGEYEYKAYAQDLAGNIDETETRVIILDTMPSEPPASISDLQNTTGTTWINWTWTNPSDDDFAYTMVYLNGVFKINTSNPYYNATNLTANTTYEIGTHTVDVNGNVNDTWVNQTARTIASQNGSVSGTITYTHNETGIAEVTVNLTQNGTPINSTVTDSSGNYTFTNISPGDYNITASKIRFWSNSTSPVTVNAGASTTANLMLWLKGDLNNDGKVSEIDLALMRSAVAEYELPIPVDWKFDINSDGKVNEVDIAIIRNMIA